jgi:A/G-specific adenine glycosylase
MKNPPGRQLKKDFSVRLLHWHRTQNTRKMPWKGEKDPYKIWLSEIILQQTRVEQGLAYYKRFITKFPDVQSLSSAGEQEVFKLWEGLGYYSRCRNLLATARHIANERAGIFPSSYEEIAELKGVGPYTAAAISSFAFGLPHAVVDGNVYRVLSRLFGISSPVDTTAGKKYFSILANELLDHKQSGNFNQAIMDFGAMICKPVPRCSDCVFNRDCKANRLSQQDRFPVRSKKKKVIKRWFSYFLINYNGKIAIRQRTGRDIWQRLYEFPQIEHSAGRAGKVIQLAESQGLIKRNAYKISEVSTVYRQQLSHQSISGQFITVRLTQKSSIEHDWLWVKKNVIRDYPFPGIINQFLQKYRVDLFDSA